jgi:hypothetical protein
LSIINLVHLFGHWLRSDFELEKYFESRQKERGMDSVGTLLLSFNNRCLATGIVCENACRSFCYHSLHEFSLQCADAVSSLSALWSMLELDVVVYHV